MNKKFLLLLFFPIMSCHLKEKLISRLWFYSYSAGEPDTTLSPLNFINLERDGSYTSDLGKFEYGRWTFKDDYLKLTNEKNKTSTYKISSIAPNEMKIVFNNTNQVFEGASPPGAADENPYSRQNNLWRIPAKTKEQEKELKSRLENHIKFWEKYFTWALNKDITSIDVRSLPTPIKIYGNGFTIKPFDELPAKWKQLFFDDQDCLNANSMLENVIRNETISWPHTDNKYKAFISVFQQLQLKLKTSNFAHIFTPPKVYRN